MLSAAWSFMLPFHPYPTQCEDRCKVRACLPTPKRGALPLPGGLPADLLAFEPQASGSGLHSPARFNWPAMLRLRWPGALSSGTAPVLPCAPCMVP